MARYKTRGHEIQAEQFFIGKPLPFRDVGPVVSYEDGVFSVETIEGDRIPLNDGDWVILEPGSTTCAYPCIPTIFDDRYERCAAPAARPVTLRVQDEKRELDERIERLQRFIADERRPSAFDRLLPDGQSKLRIQLAIMEAYSTVLGERLAHMVSDHSPDASAVPKKPVTSVVAQQVARDCRAVCHWILHQSNSGYTPIPASIVRIADRAFRMLDGLLESPDTTR